MAKHKFLILLPLLLFACKSNEQKLEAIKEMGEEKQAISLFSSMCLANGGKADRIEKIMSKWNSSSDVKALFEDNPSKEQLKYIGRFPNPVDHNNPYIVGVNKNGACFIGFNSTNPEKLRREFKIFAEKQAESIKSKAEIPAPDMSIPKELNVDFYDIKVPASSHILKFSLAAPKKANSSHQATMSIISE